MKEIKKMKKRGSLQGKLLMTIIPLFILSLASLTIFGYLFSKNLITEQLHEKMLLQEKDTIVALEKEFSEHSRIAEVLSKTVSTQGSTLDKPMMRKLLSQYISLNEETLGAGIWYEPYAYDPAIKYFGPYVYKDGDQFVYTEDYEDPSYNYHADETWYKPAIEQKKMMFTDPYYDPGTGITMVSTTVPFTNEKDKILGVVTADINLVTIQSIISGLKIEESGWALLLDSKGTIISHPNSEFVTNVSNIMDDNVGFSAIGKEILEQPIGHTQITLDSKKYLVFYNTLPTTQWKIILMVPEQEFLAHLNPLLYSYILIGIVILLLACFIIFVISKKITRTLKSLSKRVKLVAEGDLTVEMNIYSNDEIGRLSEDFNKMVHTMHELISSVDQATVQLQQSSEDLSAISEETSATGEEMAKAIKEIAIESSNIAASTEGTTETSSTLAEKLERISDYMIVMNELIQKQSSENENGLQQIELLQGKSVETVHELKEVEKVISELEHNVKSIESVIQFIDDISAQTNLLALNASIEAARAGENGKGFAVVATEVRKLAEQSSTATEKVRNTIKTIEQNTNLAVQKMGLTRTYADQQTLVMDDTEMAFSKIDRAVKELTHSIEKISQDMIEVNQFKEQVIYSIEQISASAQQTAASTQEINASTDEQTSAILSITRSAEELQRSSEELRTKVQLFKI